MNRIYFIIIFAIVASLLFEGTNIYLANKLSTHSVEAAQIQQQIESLDEKNLALKEKTLDHASYDKIASRAGELGYTTTKQFIHLNAPVQVARR